MFRLCRWKSGFVGAFSEEGRTYQGDPPPGSRPGISLQHTDSGVALLRAISLKKQNGIGGVADRKPPAASLEKYISGKTSKLSSSSAVQGA